MTDNSSDHPAWVRVAKYISAAVFFLAAFLSIVGFILAFIYPNQFGDIVEVVRGSGQEVSETVRETGADTVAAIQRLEDMAGQLEREVSDDPIRELGNRQYTLTHTDFQRAFRANDLVTLRLYCSAPVAPFVDGLSTYFSPSHPHRDGIGDEAWAIYRTCPVVRFEALCADGPYDHHAICRSDFNRAEFAEICGAARVAELVEEITRLAASATHPDDIRFWESVWCR